MNTTLTTTPKKSRQMPIIELSETGYGFGINWTLSAYGKRFYLGQDAKVCSRLLQCKASELVAQLGTNNLSSPKVRRKLARIILSHLQECHLITRSKLIRMEVWGLSVE